MNINELAAKLQHIPHQQLTGFPWCWGIACDLVEEMGLQDNAFDEDVSGRLTFKPAVTWICTDTEVGLYVIFLDQQPVATGFKRFRTSGTQFVWKSQESFEQTRAFVLSLMSVNDIEAPYVEEEDTLKYIFEWIDENCYLEDHIKSNIE